MIRSTMTRAGKVSYGIIALLLGLPLPIVCLQFVGAGKVVFHATDETHRWRFRVGDIYFAALSKRYVGWLVEQPVGLSSGINAPKDEQNMARGRQLEHETVAVVCRPQIVVRVDA